MCGHQELAEFIQNAYASTNGKSWIKTEKYNIVLYRKWCSDCKSQTVH